MSAAGEVPASPASPKRSSKNKNKPHFKSLSRSFRYEQTAHDIGVDFELDNRAFGRHKSKFRAVLCNANLMKSEAAADNNGNNNGNNNPSSSVAFLVCVDVIPQKRLADSAQKETLLRELRVAMALRHANLNTLHGFNDFDRESFYIVEEFYDLGDSEVLKRLGLRWPEGAVAKWCKDVLLALAFLHAKGVAYEHLALPNIVVNHRGRVKLTCTALLSAVGAADAVAAAADAADSRHTISDGDIGIRWAVARSQYASSRARDMLDFVVLAFDLFRLRWQTWDATLRSYYAASPFMADFFQRLHRCNLEESKTLAADMLLEHPWLKPANDKANEQAMLAVVAQAKAARQHHRRARPADRAAAAAAAAATASPSASGAAPTLALSLSISVPLLGLRNELFEFRNLRVEVKAGKHNVDRIKRLVLHYYVKSVMLPATTHADDFFFVVPRKHARAVRLDDSLQFADYRGLRGRNGEFRLVLLQEGGPNSNRMPAEPPSSPPGSPRGSAVRAPRSPRQSRARPRSMSPRRPTSPRDLSPRAPRVATAQYNTQASAATAAAAAAAAAPPAAPAPLVTQSERQPPPPPADQRRAPAQPTSVSERFPPGAGGSSASRLVKQESIALSRPLMPHRVPPAPLQGTRALSPTRAPPLPNNRASVSNPYVTVSPAPSTPSSSAEGVRETPPPSLPKWNDEPLYGNWVASHTPTGAKYYYNRTLDISSWKHPSAMTDEDLQKLKTQARQRNGAAPAGDDRLQVISSPPSARSSAEPRSSPRAVDAPSPLSSRAPSSHAHLTNEELETLVRAEVRPQHDAAADARRREWDAFAANNDGGQLQRTAALRPVIDEELSSTEEDDDDSASGGDEDERRNIAPLVFAGDSGAPARPTTVPRTLGHEEGDVLRAALHQASLLRAKLDMQPNSGKTSLTTSAASTVPAATPPKSVDYQPMQPFRVVALFDNVPEHDGELAFDAGDTITVFASEGGWYEGQHDESGIVAWFSSNYTKPLD